MARMVFAVGANTHGLRYAERDVALVAQAFQRYAYQVVAPRTTRKSEILEQFEQLLDHAGATDTLIVYFSGHAVPEAGELQFLLTDGADELSKKINLNQLVQTFEKNKRVRHKLVILDCCSAGSSTAQWSSDFLESYCLLTSSGKYEQGKELDELQASFMTARMVFALEHPDADVVDDGKIRVQSLYKWLEHEAHHHNATQNVQVSVPNLLGNLRANFDLVTLDHWSAGAPVTPVSTPSLGVPLPPGTQSRTVPRHRVLSGVAILGVLLLVGLMIKFFPGHWFPIVPGWEVGVPETERRLRDGLALLQQGRLEESGEYFSQWLAEEPSTSTAWYGRAMVAKARQNYGGAETYLQQALHHAPEDRRSLRALITVLLLRGGQSRDVARQRAEGGRGHTPSFDQWVSCLQTQGFFEQLIIDEGELRRLCPYSEPT